MSLLALTDQPPPGLHCYHRIRQAHSPSSRAVVSASLNSSIVPATWVPSKHQCLVEEAKELSGHMAQHLVSKAGLGWPGDCLETACPASVLDRVGDSLI